MRLTELSNDAGGAGTLGRDALAGVLRRLHDVIPAPAERLVGDDAGGAPGIHRISPDTHLVQTVDLLAPVVDEAKDWGRIAATHVVSGVHALGGTPITALSMVRWPSGTLPLDLLGDVLVGAASVLAAAGCTVIGGHAAEDAGPRYGLAVTGVVHPDDATSSGTASVGDVLLLTKPVGTGIISAAIAGGVATPGMREAAVASMTTSGDGAARAVRRIRARTVTRLAGSGLLGGLGAMIRTSGVSAAIDAAAVPLLPGVEDLAGTGVVPVAAHRNLESVSRFTAFGGLVERRRLALCDPQVSGGVVIAVEPPMVGAMLQALDDEGIAGHRIGEITARAFADGPTGRISIR